MIDSFPWRAWGERVTTFWAFGPGEDHDLLGTYILTGLGMALMIAALVYWVWLENRKLTAQAELLRAAGGLPLPGDVPGPGPSQPPLAGPTTEPGE
ncbi:MAG: hypothetical protein M3292_06630 [Actinomycetota bacterium]|jgi:hypothetical protein|nr:hypothetical protein [Actinomycetota bacterium]